LVSALFIEDSNGLSADAGVTNSDATSSTSNLNILPPNPLCQFKQPLGPVEAGLQFFVSWLEIKPNQRFLADDFAKSASGKEWDQNQKENDAGRSELRKRTAANLDD